MQSKATTVAAYIDELPEDRKKPVQQLRKLILKNLPRGFEEVISYGMIGYVVPHKIYPDGYHCDPKQPVPFMSLAAQKNFIAVYHMGVYSIPELNKWFTQSYAKATTGKLDMGKSCIRFKNPDKIPYELIGELASKITVKDWISYYEKNIAKK